MKFEYDPEKSAVNKAKHGIDFEAAKRIWDGEAVVLEAKTIKEARFMIMGWVQERLYSCIFTVRQDKIRIISCRRSRDKERVFYHEKTGN